MFNILQQRRLVRRSPANIFRLVVGTIKETASLTEDPTIFDQLDPPLLQRLIRLVQLRNPVLELLLFIKTACSVSAKSLPALEDLGAFCQVVDFSSRRGGSEVRGAGHGTDHNPVLFHLRAKEPELSFDIIESSDLFGEGSLEGGNIGVQLQNTQAISFGSGLQRVDQRFTTRKRATHIAKLNQAHFSECADCFSADFCRYVQLYERHLGRAEHRVWFPAHFGGVGSFEAAKVG
jgi:hypothetical protein